jgi:hypothetical protein
MKLPLHYPSAHWARRKKARLEYIKRQDNLCHHCNQSLDWNPKREFSINESLFPPNFFQYPIHLHHDHNTGMTIGAVHAYCNAVLWEYHGE